MTTRRAIAQRLMQWATELMQEDGEEEAAAPRQMTIHPVPEPDAIKAPEVARILGCSEDTVRMLAAQDRIPHWWIPSSKGKGRAQGGREQLRFSRRTIIAWTQPKKPIS